MVINTLRKIIGHIAKRLYKKKYSQLREKLLIEYTLLLNRNTTLNFDLLSKLLISGEDHRFYYHIGFDIIAILRAIRNRLFFNKIEGASTIEQQLVRVLTNDFEKTFRRKLQEILLSTTVTSIVPKKAILEIYLNIAHYGTNMNGLKQVMIKLSIKEEDIPVESAAEIISRIKYPQQNILNKKREIQIETRKKHLVSLYNKHLLRKYFKVYG